MTVPLWSLLGFAAWTVLLLLLTVGVSFEQTNTLTSVRFIFFFVQIVGFLWLVGLIVARAAPAT
ncbi:MAG TPA: hypothetical protein VJS42_18080 [Steroidobacteraceae bacterium]|nr:hypothetical protein [Steroidobacteraceae bacterium]